MKHILINPTWKCQLDCAYCWMPHAPINTEGKERSGEEWARALLPVLSAGDLVDICGGEPTLWRGLETLIRAFQSRNILWAMTTNLLYRPALERLAQAGPAGCVVINVSLHEGNREIEDNVKRMQAAGFRLSFHLVDHPAAPRDGTIRPDMILPYQQWKEQIPTDGKRRRCNAGTNHWTADPVGDLWRCSVHAQLGLPPLGNLFTRQVTPLSDPICDTGCTTCYTDNPAGWGVRMEVIDTPEEGD